jgi:hypothetical protein
MSTATNQEQLSESAAGNLDSIEEEIETSSQYFKPKPDKPYVISMDPQKDKIVPVENDRFKDANGNQPYQLIYRHLPHLVKYMGFER